VQTNQIVYNFPVLMATNVIFREQELGLCLISLALLLTIGQGLSGPFMLIMMVENGTFLLMLQNKNIGQAQTL